MLNFKSSKFGQKFSINLAFIIVINSGQQSDILFIQSQTFLQSIENHPSYKTLKHPKSNIEIISIYSNFINHSLTITKNKTEKQLTYY